MSENINNTTTQRIVDGFVTSILISEKNKKTFLTFSKKHNGVFYRNKNKKEIIYFGFWKVPNNANGILNYSSLYEGITIKLKI